MSCRQRPLRLMHIVGVRPNFVKLAPLLAACEREPDVHVVLVHTGQHEDDGLSGQFFRDLQIRDPDVRLDTPAGSPAARTGAMIAALDPVFAHHDPDAAVVFGDVDSTLAGALVATKRKVPVVHIEAGLRSYDRTMPEENNRRLVDTVSDWFFCTEESAMANLEREGVPRNCRFLVGNLMADALLTNRRRAPVRSVLRQFGLEARRYAVVTLHRPSNVDVPSRLAELLTAVDAVQRHLPVVLPVHPRLDRGLTTAGLRRYARGLADLRLLPPLGYLECLGLLDAARVVLTDSGGIQDETTVLGVPCITLRLNTERPATVQQGTNRLAGSDSSEVLEAFHAALRGYPAPLRPPYWDGATARRIVTILARVLRATRMNGASTQEPATATHGQHTNRTQTT